MARKGPTLTNRGWGTRNFKDQGPGRKDAPPGTRQANISPSAQIRTRGQVILLAYPASVCVQRVLPASSNEAGRSLKSWARSRTTLLRQRKKDPALRLNLKSRRRKTVSEEKRDLSPLGLRMTIRLEWLRRGFPGRRRLGLACTDAAVTAAPVPRRRIRRSGRIALRRRATRVARLPGDCARSGSW
jgi:hypothetical protein